MRNETLTSFLRDTKKYLKRVDREDVVLNRRGKASIRISLESRVASSLGGLEVATDLLADAWSALVAPSRVELLKHRFAWMRLLPPRAQEEFAGEFVETVQACASVGNSAPLAELIHAWKSTAAIYADPVLAAQLQRPLQETGHKVERP